MMALMVTMRMKTLLSMNMAFSWKRRKALWITQYHWSAPLARGEGLCSMVLRAGGGRVAGNQLLCKGHAGTNALPRPTETTRHYCEADSARG